MTVALEPEVKLFVLIIVKFIAGSVLFVVISAFHITAAGRFEFLPFLEAIWYLVIKLKGPNSLIQSINRPVSH